MRARIVAIDPAAQDGNGRPSRVERAPVRLTVDPASEAAHDDEPRRGKLTAEHTRDLGTVGGAASRADDGNGRLYEQLDPAPDEQLRRRVVELREHGRIPWAAPESGQLHAASSAGDR